MKRRPWKRGPYRLPALKRMQGKRSTWYCHQHRTVLRKFPPRKEKTGRRTSIEVQYTTAAYVAAFCSLNHLKG